MGGEGQQSWHNPSNLIFSLKHLKKKKDMIWLGLYCFAHISSGPQVQSIIEWGICRQANSILFRTKICLASLKDQIKILDMKLKWVFIFQTHNNSLQVNMSCEIWKLSFQNIQIFQ